MMDSAFYERLRTFMNHKNLNINEFSRETGFSSGALSKILNGKKSFGIDKLMNIFITFPELKPQWLLLGEGEMLHNPEQEERLTPVYVRTLEKENLILGAKLEALQDVLKHVVMVKELPYETR